MALQGRNQADDKWRDDMTTPTEIFETLSEHQEIKNHLLSDNGKYFTCYNSAAGQSIYFYLNVSLGNHPTQQRCVQVRLSDHFSNEVIRGNMLCIYNTDNAIEKILNAIEKIKNDIFLSNKKREEEAKKLKRLQKIAFQISTPKKICKFLRENFSNQPREVKNCENEKGLFLFLSKNSF